MINIGFNSENNLESINRRASSEPLAFIKESEEYYTSTMHEVALKVSGEKGRTIVLLSGPSGSGKTTSANKIMQNLIGIGIDAVTISFDNFYKGRNEAPLLEDGRPDYETIYALDIPVMQQCLKDIIENGVCYMPEFDFTIGLPKAEKLQISLGEDGVVILEGIHALNPIVIDALNLVTKGKIFKIFVSVGEGIRYNGKEIISPRDIRLMRRMTRDFTHRASSPANTLQLWTNVIAGEKKYLEPFAGTADININSLHLYEPCVFKENIGPLLEAVKPGEENYFMAYKISEFLKSVVSISEISIPEDSLLNEFIIIENKTKKEEK